MGLQQSYTLIAPFYDAAIARATAAARQRSLQALPETPGRVLLAGIGTGLDLPHLPAHHHYIGLDLTHAMLHCAVLHLILAVVPQPARCLAEVSRCLRPGGEILIFDKFLQRGQRAPLRRLLNPLLRRIATRLDVVFEELLAETPALVSESNQAALAGGWFRLIRLRKF